MNAVDALYAKAARRKVPLIRIAVSADELASGRAAKRFPTGATLIYRAHSVDDAKAAVAAAGRAGGKRSGIPCN